MKYPHKPLYESHEVCWVLFSPELNSYGYFDECSFVVTDFLSVVKWHFFTTESSAIESFQSVIDEKTLWVEVKKVFRYTYNGE